MKCVVQHCENRIRHRLSGISFHSFPKDEILCKKWLDAIGRPSFEPKKSSYVCSDHFKNSDLVIFKTRTLLKETAVPVSLFEAHIIDSKHELQEDRTTPAFIFVDVNRPEHIDKISQYEIIQEKTIIPTKYKSEENNFDAHIIDTTQESQDLTTSTISSEELDRPQSVDGISQEGDMKTDALTIKECMESSDEEDLVYITLERQRKKERKAAVSSEKLDRPREGDMKTDALTIKECMESSDEEDSVYITPERQRYRAKLFKLRQCVIHKNKQIKTLNQKQRRKTRRICRLISLLKGLKEKGIIDDEMSELLHT